MIGFGGGHETYERQLASKQLRHGQPVWNYQLSSHRPPCNSAKITSARRKLWLLGQCLFKARAASPNITITMGEWKFDHSDRAILEAKFLHQTLKSPVVDVDNVIQEIRDIDLS